MAGMAERYWKELRPSSAARFRLDATVRNDPKPTDRDLHRPRHRSRPRPRVTARHP
jgi:hypothetical protein